MIHLLTHESDRRNSIARHRVGRAAGPAGLFVTSYLGTVVLFLIVLGGAAPQLCGQQKTSAKPQKVPAAEKIVENFLKAIGGKKRVTAIRDASLEYSIQLNSQQIGVAKLQTKGPASARSELTFGNGSISSAASASSAWTKGLDGELHTLTGAESGAAKLQALLDASHLVDLKKSNIAARVISLGDLGSEPAFIVEFSTRNGAKVVYYFSRSSGLITKIEDDARKLRTRFADYRLENGINEPHQIKIDLHGTGELTLLLQRAEYNTGILPSVFDPPGSAETLDVAALMREVSRNQDQLEQRFTEYSYLQKEIDREINGQGEVKKETIKLFEVFPVANRGPILKLLSENGTPLTTERAAKEEKRVQEEFLKAERERDKTLQKKQEEHRRIADRRRKKAQPDKQEENDDVEVSQFLWVCEFVSPRHERFRDRDAVVFNFRARPGFKPSSRQEDLISKLVGVVWIDPIDKQVMRLEARLAEGFKMGGGLVLSLRTGAAFVMEQTRMDEGVWLPRFAQVNLSVKVLLFGGGDINKTLEWSEYKHYKGDVKDFKVDTPNTDAPPKKP